MLSPVEEPHLYRTAARPGTQRIAGFADRGHFSNLFKRQTGFFPSAYRRWARAR
jgi:hypothetical protein